MKPTVTGGFLFSRARATRNATASSRARVPAGPEAGAGGEEGRDGALKRRAGLPFAPGTRQGEGRP